MLIKKAMEFTLFYRGKVKSKGEPSDKHEMRKYFRHQLEDLWNLPPLNEHPGWRKRGKLRKKINGVSCVFLVTKKLHMYVELSINVLIPWNKKPPAKSASPFFRDIDNKLKTLCDALFFPNFEKYLPLGQKGKKADAELLWLKNNPSAPPFLCLLEDDELIYKIHVDTDYLLAHTELGLKDFKKNESIWIINVKIKGNRFDEKYKDLIV